MRAAPAATRLNPPPAPRNEPYKTHLAYVKERRSDADGAAILEEALELRLEATRVDPVGPGTATSYGEAMRSSPGGAGPLPDPAATECGGRPRAPAAGTWTSPPPQRHPDGGRLLLPGATSQTSSAARMAGSVRVSRMGGGFGAPCTATTGRALVQRRLIGKQGRDVRVRSDAEEEHVERGHAGVVLGWCRRR